jgi:alkanesulfonate monooxygenase SsuD/methylene tetrahydromethanopterin reductase-like flavin-dependent oxidoreductase (luciferase family)
VTTAREAHARAGHDPDRFLITASASASPRRHETLAELAGRVGDGLNAPAGPRLVQLVATAREAHARAGHDPDRFLITASASASPRRHETLAELGVHRAIVHVAPPYVDGVMRLARDLAAS